MVFGQMALLVLYTHVRCQIVLDVKSSSMSNRPAFKCVGLEHGSVVESEKVSSNFIH